jgi:hypothetical protein
LTWFGAGLRACSLITALLTLKESSATLLTRI